MSASQPQITNRRPLVIAHRGASVEQPENTFAAFRRALALGVDGIELDVHVTRDGVPFVYHDPNFQRLNGCRRRVTHATWRELRSLRIGGAEPIPRLSAVLRLIRGRAIVQIEIKPGVPVAPVLRAVRAARAQAGVILSSFSLSILNTAARLAPSMPRMLIYSGSHTAPTLVRKMAAVGAACLCIDQRDVKSAAFVRYFRIRGHSVWCWTVNRPVDMRRLASFGVTALVGDDPALLQRTLRQ
jgi:glycerophosphoryl diester phosphodiesterase